MWWLKEYTLEYSPISKFLHLKNGVLKSWSFLSVFPHFYPFHHGIEFKLNLISSLTWSYLVFTKNQVLFRWVSHNLKALFRFRRWRRCRHAPASKRGFLYLKHWSKAIETGIILSIVDIKRGFMYFELFSGNDATVVMHLQASVASSI